MMRVVIASIILVATIVSPFIVIAPVAWMVVAILATMLPVVQTTAASNRKMSRFLLLWLFLLLELVKDTGCFVRSLALLSHEPKWDRGHRFVCLRMHHWLREKDLFCFLLRCGQLRCSMEESAVEVARELHLMLNKFMHLA
jgi:hypothetical protein